MTSGLTTLPIHGHAITTSTAIPSLPHVVWRCIAFHLSDSLETLLHLAGLSPDLRKICRPHISAFFQRIEQPIAPLPSADYYCHLVQLVLEGFIDPSSVREFSCWARRTNSDGKARSSEGAQSSSMVVPRKSLQKVIHGRTGISKADERRSGQLLRDTIRAIEFIPPDLEPQILAGFEFGDSDAAMAVLLPLCTKLKVLEIPESSPLCATVVQAVAREYEKRGISTSDARRTAWDAALRDRSAGQSLPVKGSLPFSELLVLCTIANEYGFTYPVINMTPFMGIPSLHRIVLQGVRDRTFPGWPVDTVSISCPEIYFQQSSFTKRAVLAFAEGILGPCEIRQWFERDVHFGSDSLEGGHATWDRLVIQDGNAYDSSHVRLDFAGGNPGKQHAWSSWLFHGKMIDWTRLDEKFHLDEEDDMFDELVGLLA